MSDETFRSTGPRIGPEGEPDSEQLRLLSKTLLTPSSEPLNLFLTLVRHPELMKRVNALGGLFMAHGSLPEREREIVILRVACNTRCDYEFAQHVSIGQRSGLTQEEIKNLGRPLDQDRWGDNDLALLRFTDEIMENLEVSDEVWEQVSRSHDDNQMMELVMLVGYYRMLAAFLKTTRVPLEEESPRLPDAK